VEHLIEYIEAQDILNHLDISGLGFQKEDIRRICETIALSNFLCSVHLNDNGIKFADGELSGFCGELHDVFGLSQERREQGPRLVHNLPTH
jgi:hypothetical protein